MGDRSLEKAMESFQTPPHRLLQNQWGGERRERGAEPVSYTHLDVYKRQTLLMGVIKQEMGDIRDKFADERRTELTHLEGEIDIEMCIRDRR